ncbi:MAG: holliday junction helicase RuvA [Myxococcales bacterium]|jgi:Holliday junction DNA helicase RuvA|nr:holliday junction helicase RuvA [Myxococcales bacterium]
MIASLRGRLAEHDLEAIVVEVAGIGYQVLISGATVGSLPPVGSEVFVHVHSHFVKDEPLRLYGFVDAGERALFETLLSVQGVGPRVALAILAGLPPAELVRAITKGDVNRLTQIKGVGRKIAERLSLELRDKIGALPIGQGAGGAGVAAPSPSLPTGKLGDVHGALVALGYRPAEILPLLDVMDETRPIGDLVKQALSALQKR